MVYFIVPEEKHKEGAVAGIAREYDFDPLAVDRILRWHLSRHREYTRLQPADKEDLLASAMEIFVTYYHTYDPAKSKLVTWTKFIARSALFRRRTYLLTSRRGFGRQNVSLDELSEVYDGEPSVFPRMLTTSHENGLINRLAVIEIIKRLPYREQQVIILRYYCDKTLTQTGEILRVSRERVRQLEARAFIKLRAHLVDETGPKTEVTRASKLNHASYPVPLSPADEALLNLIVERKTIKEIAAALSLSQVNARRWRSILLERIGASNYKGAARYLENVHKSTSSQTTSREGKDQKRWGE